MATTAARPADDVEGVVRRYYATVADLASSEDDLRPLLAPGIRVTEHPNAVTPAGAVRDRDATLAGFHAGKSILREQVFDVQEVLVSGDRAAVRATWRAVVSRDAGPFRGGQELVAHVAAFLTVREGTVWAHETFDCYEPLARD